MRLPIFLAFAIGLLVLTIGPLVLRMPANGTLALTAVYTLLLVSYVAIMGLSVTCSSRPP